MLKSFFLPSSFLLAVLSFFAADARAETAQPFNFLQAGYAEVGFSCGMSETTKVRGGQFSASWQFQPKWFVGAQYFDSEKGHENCTDAMLSVTAQSVSLGGIFHSTESSDWFGRLGWLHREYPDDEQYPGTGASYSREFIDRDDPWLTAGARHQFGRYFELSWEAGVIAESSLQPYGSVSPRWLASDQFSLGLQLAFLGDFSIVSMDARFRF